MLLNSVQTLLLKGNVTLGTATAVDEVEQLIRRLHPIAVETPLVRIGSAGDGGYVVPDCLSGIEACFSPGVDKSVAFELDLAKRGIRSFLADYSIDTLPESHEMLDFRKVFLAGASGDNEISLSDWIDSAVSPDSGDLLLQMDIEESEYEVLLATPRSVLQRFRIVVVEFHALHKLFDRFSFSIVRRAFDKLLVDFDVMHTHPNNCCGSVTFRGIEVPKTVEMTFLRRDHVVPSGQPYTIPEHLDADCEPRNKPLELPPIWWRR